ncbi:MAG: ABC transporter permease [Acidobacteria bacterium]|nr:MAG: ABC transporter permease [Acidobacteriota bacterium]
MGKDLRFAVRMLRRSPGFTILAVVVLALGIGANTAIFSMINAILLQPLPYAHPQQLVQMYETERAPGSYPLSGPDFPDWQRQSKLFAAMTLYNYPHNVNLTGNGAPQQVAMVPAEANFFQVLGVQAALGRMFQPGDSDSVAVLSYAFWKSQFGGARSVLNRAITLDGKSYTIIGVTAAKFRLSGYFNRAQLWRPLPLTAPYLGQRGNHSFSAIGRMKPGVTLAQAQAEISAIAARLAQQYPDSNATTGAKLDLLRDRMVRAPQRASLLTLLGVVALVLLIACANLANMLLARALGRQKEISIRLALGARRSHILRQLLTESVLLSLLGAAFGAMLAWLGIRAVVGLSAFTLPQVNPIAVNGTVLAFTVVLAMVCGILFGLAPALQLSHPRLSDELSGAGTLAGAGRRRRWLSDGLIIAEVALSMLLVVAAGVFMQSFSRLRNSALGVNPNHLLIAQLSLPDARYKSPAVIQFHRTLLARLRALPGITQAATSGSIPLNGESNGYITLPGESTQSKTLVEWVRATPSYFATMQIPLLRGSTYTSADVQAWDHFITAAFGRGGALQLTAAQMASYHLQVVVNQAMADHFWPGRNPLGKRFQGWGTWLTIKGVVGTVAVNQLGEAPWPVTYFPLGNMDTGFYVELRSSLPAAAVTADLRRTVAGIDASLPLYGIQTMDQVAGASVAGEAFQEWLMTGFAALALLLAVAGIYGVMSYLVTARTREIGVRVALGASRSSVLGMVIGRGLRLGIIGIVCGLIAALAAGKLIASQLYQTKPANPVAFILAAGVLLAACVLACYVPALRAARIAPAEALRQN